MVEDLSREEIASFLPPRPEDGHKGTFGHLVSLAGSRGFTGAPRLVAMAALRSGVGLVTAAIPKPLSDVISSSFLEPMTLALESTDADTVAYESLATLLDFLTGKSALTVGPGISTHLSTARLVRRLYALRPVSMLVDADGLNALAARPGCLVARAGTGPAAQAVLTPHPGEMGRLTGMETSEIQRTRVETTSHYATRWQSVVVLKGHGTIIAAPDGRIRRCPTGNQGMATGGSGDVLAGIIGALLAQGTPPFEAACAGVYVHGLAGDIAAREKTPRGMIAGDIIDALPQAWRVVERTT